ncbi:unnamed protein product, partial [Cylicostephanus goldi]
MRERGRDFQRFPESGESIGDSDKYKVHDGLLVIESLSEHDSGEYKCIASNAVGNATQTAQLKVLLKPRVEKLLDLTKKESESVEIVCKYSGDGISNAKFVFGSEEYSVVDDEEQSKELTPSDKSGTGGEDEDGEEENDEEAKVEAENDEKDNENADKDEDEDDEEDEEVEEKENARIKR